MCQIYAFDICPTKKKRNKSETAFSESPVNLSILHIHVFSVYRFHHVHLHSQTTEFPLLKL